MRLAIAGGIARGNPNLVIVHCSQCTGDGGGELRHEANDNDDDELEFMCIYVDHIIRTCACGS